MNSQSDCTRVLVPGRAAVLACICDEIAHICPLLTDQIRPDFDLASEMDSLDVITLTLALNQRFEVDLDDARLREWRTPEQLTSAILEIAEGGERFSILTHPAS